MKGTLILWDILDIIGTLGIIGTLDTLGIISILSTLGISDVFIIIGTAGILDWIAIGDCVIFNWVKKIEATRGIFNDKNDDEDESEDRSDSEEDALDIIGI